MQANAQCGITSLWLAQAQPHNAKLCLVQEHNSQFCQGLCPCTSCSGLLHSASTTAIDSPDPLQVRSASLVCPFGALFQSLSVIYSDSLVSFTRAASAFYNLTEYLCVNICMVINQLLHDNKHSLIIYSNPLFYPLIYSKTLFSFPPAIFPFVQFSGCLVQQPLAKGLS